MSNRNKYLISGIAIGVTAIVGTTLYIRNRRPQAVIFQELEPLKLADCKRRRQMLTAKCVEYDLLLAFPAGSDVYFGELEIKFDLGLHDNINLDYQKKGITHLYVNGKEVANPANLISSDQLILPKDLLEIGENVIKIKFKNFFDKNQYGLIKYEEKDIHPVLCGYLPSLVFPCFDQPDIKCTLKLRMIVPKEFTAISNEKISLTEDLTENEYILQSQVKNHKGVEFIRTKILPVHNVCFYAGEFEQLKTKKNWKTTPISFYCRPENLQTMTKKMIDLELVVFKTLDYFLSEFGCKYPFSKLDIVYTRTPCHAIEYPGAILMNEDYLLASSLADFTEGIVTLCHEIVHMWFGNITTCDSWNNIFLHESFANHVSVLIYKTFWNLSSVELLDPEVYQIIKKNQSSYLHSGLKSSHAVSFDMEEIELANTVFNPIIYHKGEHLLYYFHENMKNSFVALLNKMINSESWGNIGYQNFISYLPESDKSKFDKALKCRTTEVIHIYKQDNINQYQVHRTVNCGLNFEKVPVHVYNLDTITSEVIHFDLNATCTFQINPENVNQVFIFNHKSKIFCLWNDEPENFNKIVENIHLISELDILGYFMNLYNLCLIRNSHYNEFLLFFKTAWNVLKKADPKRIIKCVFTIFYKKIQNQNQISEIFEFLMAEKHEVSAWKFITSAEQAEMYHSYLKNTPIIDSEIWKKYFCRLHKLSLKSKIEEIFIEKEEIFNTKQFLTHMKNCSEEDIDNEFMSLVMYRTGNQNIDFYVNLLKFMADYLSSEVRFKLALKFMTNFQSISKQVSKFYIQRILGLVVPNQRFKEFSILRNEFLKAIAFAQDAPMLRAVLTNKIEILELFNH